MVAPGFYKPICFNPALVYLIAGFLIGLSLRFYMDRRRKGQMAASSTTLRQKRRR